MRLSSRAWSCWSVSGSELNDREGFGTAAAAKPRGSAFVRCNVLCSKQLWSGCAAVWNSAASLNSN
eukprot:15559-Heterococcus_DN1.PRE.2